MAALNRDQMLSYLREEKQFDIFIIGGGATGLGIAVDAASRGYKTALVEQSDFAKATSSRSTKLIHGGVRYLKQGNIALVKEALKERGLLCQNAPHLVNHLSFLVPSYHWWESPFYGIGLKVYDLLAGKLGLEKSKHVSREAVLANWPTLEPKNLRGGTLYTDGQFDDARLAITLAQTAAREGACLLNYCSAKKLIKEGALLKGILARDEQNGEEIAIRSKVVINATGVFSDAICKLDGQKDSSIIKPSQGVHLVLDRSFLPSNSAIMIPKTDDGRILFFIPWLGSTLVGTTDTPVTQIDLEPNPLDEEIEFLLEHAKRYLTKHPTRKDVKSVFAGLRPLVKSGNKSTAAISRDHMIFVSESGLITIAGGKWTTYRKMAEDAVNKAILVAKLPHSPCKTENLRLHGFDKDTFSAEKPLHPNLSVTKESIIRAVHEEMAQTLEDVLARRTRALFLDAKASLDIAPTVLKIMAHEMKKNADWEKKELEQYNQLAQHYSL